MRWRRALAVTWKDVVDVRKNRGLVASLFALPAVIVVVPIGVVFTYVSRPDDPNLRYLAQYYGAVVEPSQAVGYLVDKVLADWFVLYLLMPVFVPILISSHSVAGEKEKRTLEPLLASPVTSLELMVGKSLASLLPSFGVCLVAFALLCVGVDLVTWRFGQGAVMPTPMWLFGVLVLSPLFAFFGNGVAVLISARVGDARLAQQLAGLVILPLVGLAGAQFGGLLRSGTGYYAGLGLLVLVLDVAIVVAARRLFDRDRLMSRWG